MDIFPSFYCNNKCNFCFHKYRNNDIGDKTLLSIHKLKEILSSIPDRNYKIFLLGGELTLLDTLYQEELVSELLNYTNQIVYITTLQKIPSKYILDNTTLAISIDYGLRPYSMDEIFHNIKSHLDGIYSYEIFTMFSKELTENLYTYEKFLQLETASIIFDMKLSPNMKYDTSDLLDLVKFIINNKYQGKIVNKIFHQEITDIDFNFFDDVDLYPNGRILLRPSFINKYNFKGIEGNTLEDLRQIYNEKILYEYYSHAECMACEYIGNCIYRFNEKILHDICTYKEMNHQIMNLLGEI